MSVILDSNILIECLKNNFEVIEKIKIFHSRGTVFFYTAVSLAEIYAGIRAGEEEVIKAKGGHPQAEFLAHPECNPEVLKLAGQICSTGGMFKYARASDSREFIIGTESGMIYRLQKENPDKKFYLPSEHLICANMKLTTLGWLAHSLELEINVVEVAEDIRMRAKKSLDRMLEITYGK